MQFRTTTRLAACLVLCLGIAAVQGIVTRPEIASWYNELTKPSWTPPSFLFPIVWTALYILMAVALWRLWEKAAPSSARNWAIIDWRMASSPRFKPPYEPLMPIR